MVGGARALDVPHNQESREVDGRISRITGKGQAKFLSQRESILQRDRRTQTCRAHLPILSSIEDEYDQNAGDSNSNTTRGRAEQVVHWSLAV